ncbi:MAG: hypothetical protein ACJAT1_002302, partial [Marivirga sp.]
LYSSKTPSTLEDKSENYKELYKQKIYLYLLR